jgi:hypothetical protein
MEIVSLEGFIEETKKGFQRIVQKNPEFYKVPMRMIMTYGQGEKCPEMGTIQIGSNVNFLTEKNSELLKNEILPAIAPQFQGRNISCVAWFKLISKEGKKGLCIVFETVKGAKVFCYEMIYHNEKQNVIDDNGELIETIITFGDEIHIDDISFANKFKPLLTFPDTGKYEEENFEDFWEKENCHEESGWKKWLSPLFFN